MLFIHYYFILEDDVFLHEAEAEFFEKSTMLGYLQFILWGSEKSTFYNRYLGSPPLSMAL